MKHRDVGIHLDVRIDWNQASYKSLLFSPALCSYSRAGNQLAARLFTVHQWLGTVAALLFNSSRDGVGDSYARYPAQWGASGVYLFRFPGVGLPGQSVRRHSFRTLIVAALTGRSRSRDQESEQAQIHAPSLVDREGLV